MVSTRHVMGIHCEANIRTAFRMRVSIMTIFLLDGSERSVRTIAMNDIGGGEKTAGGGDTCARACGCGHTRAAVLGPCGLYPAPREPPLLYAN